MINEQRLRNALASNMRYLRLLKNPHISQLALARSIGTTQKSISRYERGEAMPPLCILVAIAEYYGCTVDELLQEGKPTEKTPMGKIPVEKKPKETIPTKKSMKNGDLKDGNITERNLTESMPAERETTEKRIANRKIAKRKAA